VPRAPVVRLDVVRRELRRPTRERVRVDHLRARVVVLDRPLARGQLIAAVERSCAKALQLLEDPDR